LQVLVNVSYGVPLALGLWIIGVPGALLWGALAAVMRFVPYIGPLIAAVFPVALAFAFDSPPNSRSNRSRRSPISSSARKAKRKICRP